MLLNLFLPVLALFLLSKELIILGDDFIIAFTFLLVIFTLKNFMSDVIDEEVASRNRDLLFLVDRSLSDCFGLVDRYDALYKKAIALPSELPAYFVSLHRSYTNALESQVEYVHSRVNHEEETLAILLLAEYVAMLQDKSA